MERVEEAGRGWGGWGWWSTAEKEQNKATNERARPRRWQRQHAGGSRGGRRRAVGGWAYLYRKAETCAESATAAALPHRSATTTAPAVGGKVTSFFRHRHRRAAATERSRQGHGQGLRILPTAPDMVLSAATIKGEEPVVECAEESNWSDTFGVLLRHRRGRSFFFLRSFCFFFVFFLSFLFQSYRRTVDHFRSFFFSFF